MVKMMNDKIIEEAEYAEIIVTLLNEPYAINDFIKLVFISFCIKHETKLHLKHYQNRKIDISKYQNDLSLKGEFVRSVYYRNDLTNQEKEDIISLGLRTMEGREVDL